MCLRTDSLWKYMCFSNASHMQIDYSFQQNLMFHAKWKRHTNSRKSSSLPLSGSRSAISCPPYMISTKVLITLVCIRACLSVLSQMWTTDFLKIFFSNIYSIVSLLCFYSKCRNSSEVDWGCFPHIHRTSKELCRKKEKKKVKGECP